MKRIALIVLLLSIALLFAAATPAVRAQSPLPPRIYPPAVEPPALPPTTLGELQNGQVLAPEFYNLRSWTNLAFESYRDGATEVFVFEGATGILRNISQNAASDILPALNRTGTQVAWSSYRDGNWELYVANRDGSNLRRLTNTRYADYDPVWSPDGNLIAFTSTREGNNDIWIINPQTLELARPTKDTAPDFAPVWSPDGAKIAWIRAVSGYAGQLWVMNADGSDPRTLGYPQQYMSHLAWSPSGSVIYYDADIDSDYWNEIGGFDVKTGSPAFYYDPGRTFVDLYLDFCTLKTEYSNSY